MIGRQADDLDAREASLDIDEQARVGAVEAVDRLRRITHEVQVVVAGPQHVDDPVLHRVEVLCLVDEQMAEPPADGVGEVALALEQVQGACRARR